MISFSVNNSLNEDKAKKVAKLIKDMNSYNQEYVGDAFIHLMTSTKNKNINLNNYADSKRKEEYRDLTKYDKPEENIVEAEDLDDGESGTALESIFDPVNYEDLSIERAEIDYYVENFLNVREFIFFKGGKDIWRMLTLAYSGDKVVMHKLRYLFDDYCITEFMYEFLACPYYMYQVKQILG